MRIRQVFMHAAEWIELFSRFPEDLQNKLVVALQNGTELSVDAVVRYEPTYTVIRGRVAGTDNESRAFFVPYDQMTFLRIERVVKISELQIMYGEVPTAVERDLAAEGMQEGRPQAPAASPAASTSHPAKTGRSVELRDKLLERIRATRSGNKPTDG